MRGELHTDNITHSGDSGGEEVPPPVGVTNWLAALKICISPAALRNTAEATPSLAGFSVLANDQVVAAGTAWCRPVIHPRRQKEFELVND